MWSTGIPGVHIGPLREDTVQMIAVLRTGGDADAPLGVSSYMEQKTVGITNDTSRQRN